MNLCFIIGKIVSEIKFDFIINGKSIGKNISAVRFCIEVGNEKIYVIGYNKIADKCYKELKKGDLVSIFGKMNSRLVIIEEIDKI